MACSKSSRQTEVINALDLDIVIDNILEHLPIRIAAQTSVLSKQWRRCWLSLKSLVFDEDFWIEQRDSNTSPKLKWSQIITSILVYHNGPVRNFDLYIPQDDGTGDYICHNPWLYILSKKDVKQIAIENWDYFRFNIYIFCCTELVYLVLDNFMLNPPPTSFNGYRNLKHLELIYIEFGRKNTFLSLLANCRVLAYLKLENCGYMDHIVIDFPDLKTLILKGEYLKSIAFTDVRSLESVSISFAPQNIPNYWTVDLIDVENLASSCQLQSIQFNWQMCEFLVVGGVPRYLPVTFNHLNKLCLHDLDFGGFGVFLCVLGIIERCPYIKMLDISVDLGSDGDAGRDLDYNFSRKLSQLLEVQFKGIKGSSAELKLIEYLFAISPVLEKLSFMHTPSLDTNLKLEVSQALMEFPRASPKARLVCLKN